MQGLFKVVLNESRLRDVMPPALLSKINRNPRQKALALLGDRLLDLKLYEQLLLEGENHEGGLSAVSITLDFPLHEINLTAIVLCVMRYRLYDSDSFYDGSEFKSSEVFSDQI